MARYVALRSGFAKLQAEHVALQQELADYKETNLLQQIQDMLEQRDHMHRY